MQRHSQGFSHRVPDIRRGDGLHRQHFRKHRSRHMAVIRQLRDIPVQRLHVGPQRQHLSRTNITMPRRPAAMDHLSRSQRKRRFVPHTPPRRPRQSSPPSHGKKCPLRSPATASKSRPISPAESLPVSKSEPLPVRQVLPPPVTRPVLPRKRLRLHDTGGLRPCLYQTQQRFGKRKIQDLISDQHTSYCPLPLCHDRHSCVFALHHAGIRRRSQKAFLFMALRGS